MLENIKSFIEELAATEVTPNVYNQYSYENQENSIRRDNLSIYLKRMHSLKPKVILVGEAPGYRGCRLTGVPFTSEHLLMNNMEGLELFGRENGYRLAAEKERLLREATASIIWSTLLEQDIMPLAWNAFPFHPHQKGNGQSNRTPTRKELLLGKGPLDKIIRMYGIETVVAVGNKAEENLRDLGINCTKVRHPAQGGKNDFVKGIREIKASMAK